MARWEYLFIERSLGKQFVETLNYYGAQGWRCIKSHCAEDSFKALLEREIPEPEEAPLPGRKKDSQAAAAVKAAELPPMPAGNFKSNKRKLRKHGII